MASSALRLAPWMPVARTRFKVDFSSSKAWALAKNHFSASYQLPADHPSAIAIGKMPYPVTPVDHSIFEEENLEYTSAVEESSDYSVLTSTEVLLQKVDAGSYAAAEELRAELVDLGISIPPSLIYEKAAINALRPKFTGNRLTTFVNWFSLLPDATVKPRKFRSIRNDLFTRAHTPPIDIIMRFGIIAASKGHAKCVTREVIPAVVRFTEPAVSTRYLADFEEEAIRWKRSSALKRTGAKRGTLISKGIHSLAVRTQAIAGRLGEAVALLQAAQNRGVNISEFTYSMLMRKLRQAGDEQGFKIVRELAPPSVPDTIDVRRPLPLAEELAQAPTLASRLRIVRKAMKPHSSIKLPHKAIVEFISDYRETTGQHTAIDLLRKRAIRHGRQSITGWGMVELLYHHSRNEFTLVLLVFKYYFHLLGVPADLVHFHIQALEHKRISNVRYGLQSKLWPTPYHTALVWAALVWLHDAATIDQLYMRLLSQALRNQTKDSAENVDSLNPLSVPAPDNQYDGLAQDPSQVVDAVHFTPFLVAFTKRKHTQSAFNVFADMMGLGILPGVQQWSILAGFCAEFGDARRAMWILDNMEAGSDKADTRSDSDAGTIKFPAPTLETYTGVMKSFVRAGRLDDALNVEARIMTRCRYMVGLRPRTDRVLSMLKTLQKQHGYDSWYVYLNCSVQLGRTDPKVYCRTMR